MAEDLSDLVKSLGNPDSRARWSALMVIGDLPSPPEWLVGLVVARLRDTDDMVRVLAADAFLRLVMDPSEAQEWLSEGFREATDTERYTAAGSLWDSWEGSPRAALAALGVLSQMADPEGDPMADVLAEDIVEGLR